MLADLSEYAALNKVYATYFEADNALARAAFQVVALPEDARAEIKCSAIETIIEQTNLSFLSRAECRRNFSNREHHTRLKPKEKYKLYMIYTTAAVPLIRLTLPILVPLILKCRCLCGLLDSRWQVRQAGAAGATGAAGAAGDMNMQDAAGNERQCRWCCTCGERSEG